MKKRIYINNIPNPCYDSKTKTDCYERHQGCAVDCPKWAAYAKEKDKYYAELKIKRAADSATQAVFEKRNEERRKALARDRRRRHSND